MKIKGENNILRGKLKLPGDKSISHRSIILLSLAGGRSEIKNLLESEDVLRTMEIFRELGVAIEKEGHKVIVEGVGLGGLKAPRQDLYCGNSGTTMRLMAGVLGGQKFDCTLTGDASLSKRPMDRIIDPLSKMGAKIDSSGGKPPLNLRGNKKIEGMAYKMRVASAQVKSSILLLGLYTERELSIEELSISRNHTENMLKYLGVDIKSIDGKIVMGGKRELRARNLEIPGDISSASYFIVAGTILKDSKIVLENVGVNETRTGILDVLEAMGGRVSLFNERLVNNEKLADIEVESSRLKSITIEASSLGRLIDEIPIIAVAAAFADGTTLIKSLGELRIKETDRLTAIVTELRKAGVSIWVEGDNLYIEGGSNYSGSTFNSYNDHRIAMALSIFSLACKGDSQIIGIDCINISYPDFYKDLNMLLN